MCGKLSYIWWQTKALKVIKFLYFLMQTKALKVIKLLTFLTLVFFKVVKKNKKSCTKITINNLLLLKAAFFFLTFLKAVNIHSPGIDI